MVSPPVASAARWAAPSMPYAPPCNDDPLGGSQVGGERPGDVLAVGGCGSRAGDGHKAGERAPEERRRPTSPEHVWSPLAEIAERAGTFVVARDQEAEPRSSCLEETLIK